MVFKHKSPLLYGLATLALLGVFFMSNDVHAKPPDDDFGGGTAPGLSAPSFENLPADVDSTSPDQLCIDQNSVKDCEFYLEVPQSNNYQAYFAKVQTWIIGADSEGFGGGIYAADSNMKIDMCLDSDTSGWNSSPALCHTVFNGLAKDYSIYQTNKIDISSQISNYTDYNYIWTHIRVYKTGTTNELYVAGRRVRVEDISTSPEPGVVGTPFTVSWSTKWSAETTLFWDGPAGIGSGSAGVSPNGSMSFTPTGPGQVYFTIRAKGPGGTASSSIEVQAHREITILPAGMAGDIRSDFLSCAKSASNDCNVVLNYWTTGATSAAIYLNSASWRTIPSGVVPNGTQVWNDPPIGTYTFALMGSNGGPLMQLDTVVVNIYPDSPPSPYGPNCNPDFVIRNAGQTQRFDAIDGDGTFTWSVIPQGGATASNSTGSGPSFTTSFSGPGDHIVRVTSRGLTNDCVLQVPGSISPPVTCSPPNSTVTIYNPTTFTAAYGPSTTYNWSVTPASDASPPTDTGATFDVTFTNVGPKSVTVTSGTETATCTVQVVASTCSTLLYPTNASTLPMGKTSFDFSYNSAPGRTNYIVDLSTDPSLPTTWWWNNGTGSGGPGSVFPSSPIVFGITTPTASITNTFYSEGRMAPGTLLNGQTYYWRVYAYNASDLSQPGCWTAVNSFTIDTTVPTFRITYASEPLERPVLKVTKDICREMNLSWTYVDNGVGQGFRIYRSTSGTLGSFVQLPRLAPANIGIGARTYRDNDAILAVGQTYFYRIDTYTNASPSRVNPSEVAQSTVVDCTADFSLSTYRITNYRRAGATSDSVFVPGTSIRDGDTLQFQITLTNIGPANASIRNLTAVKSDTITSPGTYRINRGSGFSSGTLAVAGNDMNFNLTSGTKCVSPDNPTNCANATDRSCSNVAIPKYCNNWLITYRAVVDADTDSGIQDRVSSEALLEFQDLTGVRYQRITLPTVLFQTPNKEAPEFREVAP